MTDKLMIGWWRYMLRVPAPLWEKQIAKAKKRFEKENRFISHDHRVVHHFVVRELPRAGGPLSPDFIADRLGLPVGRIRAVLDDLEKHMTFLFRNDQGEVVWAYPVTVVQTPHHVMFQTGEQLYAA
jgi:hypothetical protein